MEQQQPLEQEALTLDVLAESLNLGLGHVIDELGEVSNSKIQLHVPEVNMVPKSELLGRDEYKDHDGISIFVRQLFSGDIDGEALLYFNETESLKLLNALLDENEANLIEFAATEQEMLLDLTNVAVSGVIYALSQVLGLNLITQLPECEYGKFTSIETQSTLFSDAEDMILFLTISFTVVEKDCKAQLLFFQPKDNLKKLYDIISQRMGL
jgi:chemotaxis protein CheY-P-specific phosphatase CheC